MNMPTLATTLASPNQTDVSYASFPHEDFAFHDTFICRATDLRRLLAVLLDATQTTSTSIIRSSGYMLRRLSRELEATESSPSPHHTAFDPYSRTKIPFSSTADTLIARLRLESGLDVSTINLFLGILRNPQFKPSELTIRHASDIDQAIAFHRAVLQRARAGLGGPNSFMDPVPYPILEHILDAINEDDGLVDEPLHYQIPLINQVEYRRSDCLRTLALVHRSWTIPSQQRLARRIIIRSPSEVVRLLRSPLPGRHTIDLLVSIGDMGGRGFHVTVGDEPVLFLRPGDLESDLCSLLGRMTHLRRFTLKECGLREDLLLPVISQLQTLESLSWHCAHGYPSCDFSHLAEALKALPSVNQLEISGWSFHASGSVTAMPLRRQLRDLRVCISPGDLQMNRVGWLLQALSVDCPTSLTLDITLIGTLSMVEVFHLFPGALENLRHLNSLHIINKGGFVEFNLVQARQLVQACENLQNIHIQSQSAPISEFLDILPGTVEILCFSWFDMWMSPWNLVEAHLPGLVQGNCVPQLKRIVIYNYEIPFYRAPVEENGEPVSHPCPETQEACDAQHIDLDLWSKPPDWRAA